MLVLSEAVLVLEQRCKAKNNKPTTTRFKPFGTNRVHARPEVVLVLSEAVLSAAVLVLEQRCKAENDKTMKIRFKHSFIHRGLCNGFRLPHFEHEHEHEHEHRRQVKTTTEFRARARAPLR